MEGLESYSKNVGLSLKGTRKSLKGCVLESVLWL